MSLRDTFESRPPWQKYTAILVLLAVPLSAIAWQLWPENGVEEAIRSSILLKCANCGHVHELTAEEARGETAAFLGRDSNTRLRCPECQRRAARIAERCPNDGTVFVPEYATGAISEKDRCPVCGWNRVEELLRSTEKHTSN